MRAKPNNNFSRQSFYVGLWGWCALTACSELRKISTHSANCKCVAYILFGWQLSESFGGPLGKKVEFHSRIDVIAEGELKWRFWDWWALIMRGKVKARRNRNQILNLALGTANSLRNENLPTTYSIPACIGVKLYHSAVWRVLRTRKNGWRVFKVTCYTERPEVPSTPMLHRKHDCAHAWKKPLFTKYK